MSKRIGDPGYAPNWCTHFRSAWHYATCEAGVKYATWKNVEFRQRPCFLDNGQSRPNAAICTQIRRPTTEEIALHEAWVEERMNLIRTVRAGIAPWRKAHIGESAAEIVECPACGGRLHLAISGSHVHGRCETQDCVSWME